MYQLHGVSLAQCRLVIAQSPQGLWWDAERWMMFIEGKHGSVADYMNLSKFLPKFKKLMFDTGRIFQRQDDFVNHVRSENGRTLLSTRSVLAYFLE